MEVTRTCLQLARPFSVGILLGAAVVFFALTVSADNDIIRPDADGTTLSGTAVGCTGDLRYECLNDDVTQPSSPDSSSDYLQLANTQSSYSQLGTIADVQTVTAITVWVFHREGGTNARSNVGLYAANETTVYGTLTTLPLKTTAGWDSVTYTGLSLTQAQLNDMRIGLSCSKQGGGSSNDCFFYAAYADVTYSPVIEVTVGTTGTQQNLDIGSTFAHIGGTFRFEEEVSNRNITSITITENGTVDANDGLKNVALYYDLDQTGADGYNCSDQSFNGNETQFGATSTNGFSGDDGTITFTGSVPISTISTMCAYVVLDIATTTSAGQTIEVQITNPSVDVVASGTNVDILPTSVIALAGQTTIQAQERDQFSYHWRNDDGNENNPGGATSATGGTPTTTYDTLGKLTPTRLRIGVSNSGNRTSDATQYRLEYGRKISTCQNVANDSSWIDVGAGGGDWDMFDTSNLTNGLNTTNIAVSIGGVPDPAGFSFLATNGGQRDTTSQTGSLTLAASQFVELEYSIEATAAATEGFTYCFRLTNAGSPIESYSFYPEATILADVNVSSNGTQRTTIDIPTTNAYLGGQFVFTDNIAGTTTLQSITLTASGTADLQNDIDELQLFYEFDTTSPYNCVGLSYNGTEAQFGSTLNGFSATNTATFSHNVDLNSNRALCVYVVFDAASSLTDGELIDVKIQDASTDVVINAGTISPAALVDLAGTTMFVTDTTALVHYHWRNDNGSETGATSATDNTEDTLLENLRRTTPIRLRLGVANLGSSTTPPYQYRLEYGLKVTTCSNVASDSAWIDVGATDDAFNMFNSANITDGANTTNIAVTSGGVTDVGDTFLSSNGGLRDVNSQTGSITLPGKNFVDLEFAMVASTTAVEGATYCFRVTNAGSPLDQYSVYPEVSIKPRTGFFVQRGTVDISGTSATINAGTQYIAPLSTSSAFIRIVGTHNTGAGSPTNSGAADDVTVYISNPANIGTSITFTRPATAVDTTRVAWEIIEFTSGTGGDNEFIVRQAGTATYTTGNATVSTGAIPGIVNGNDVVVFITGQANPDTGTAYPLGISTAAFSTSTNVATFTRGATGNAAVLSYAVVEFIGDNWRVQRAEHTYTAAGATETESISPVNSLSRAFIHTQKRIGAGLVNHADFGHTVFLSGVGQVSFALQSSASTPGSHTSVAWVIENTQTVGDTMLVTRSNGSESAGTAPKTVTTGIGTTISDTQDASLFINNHGNESGGGGDQNSFPEPIISGEIINETQYQHWVAQPSNDTRTWRAEVVEWPTASRNFEQNYFYFFANNDALVPTDPWPPGPGDVGENGVVTIPDGPIARDEVFRLRMTVRISAAVMDEGIDAFTLQYGEKITTCDAVTTNSQWLDVGEIGSTTALWRGTSTPITDGVALSTDPPGVGDLKITSVADVAGTFEEENPSSFTPYPADPGEDIEFDWVVQHNGAKEKTEYCFRMIESNGTEFDAYANYPIMLTAGYTPLLSRWQWFDDETSLTPVASLAAENAAPSSVSEGNIIKLRTTIAETTGGVGENIKFKLQFSELPDFSSGVFDVVASSTCAATATTTAQLWCYADGSGVDNAVIDSAVLSDADSCSGGVGTGCGTHNEGAATTSATYDQPALSVAEYEFTIAHNGARANAVYYFRLFDLTNATTVPASSSLPSLQVAGAELVFTSEGLPAGTETEGITTDTATASTSITFGSVPFDTEYEGAYRLTVNTNATEGYQAFMIADQVMQNSFGQTIPSITGTNAVPVGWGTGCLGLIACFGYHTGDDSLAGGSARFAPDDSYAAISTSTLEEVAFSPVPTNESHDIIYKIQVGELQPPGEYSMGVTFIVIPVF